MLSFLVGVHTDEEIALHKGPPVFTQVRISTVFSGAKYRRDKGGAVFFCREESPLQTMPTQPHEQSVCHGREANVGRFRDFRSSHTAWGPLYRLSAILFRRLGLTRFQRLRRNYRF